MCEADVDEVFFWVAESEHAVIRKIREAVAGSRFYRELTAQFGQAKDVIL